MGCAESRQKESSSQPLLSEYPRDNELSSLPFGMGQPPSQFSQQPQSLAGPSQLSSQHERLILELLPFKEPRQFHEWLNGIYVRGAWNEFVRDFMARSPLTPDPDKTRVAQKAKEAINGRKAQYLMYHPDKSTWSADDHYIRFIVVVVQDNMLKDLWSESDWKKRSIEIAKAVYEVLAYLRATSLSTDASPPGYEA